MALPKDHLTEKQALAKARAEGIEFADEYHVTESIGGVPISVHKTQKQAEKAAKKGQLVSQVRRQKINEES